jgi:hypothetical protein
MPKLASILVIACFISGHPLIAQEAKQPKLSAEKLTGDQMAIYRAVLKNYLKGSRDSLRVSNTTEPFEQEWRSIVEGCITGFKPEPNSTIVHRLDPSLSAGLNLVIVDPEQQMAEVKANDPQNLIKGAIDQGDKISEKQLDSAVKKAFEGGFFTLSEIVFDKEHLNAMVAYSFVCGGLCGSGNTLALRKFGKQWRIVRTCSSWVS